MLKQFIQFVICTVVTNVWLILLKKDGENTMKFFTKTKNLSHVRFVTLLVWVWKSFRGKYLYLKWKLCLHIFLSVQNSIITQIFILNDRPESILKIAWNYFFSKYIGMWLLGSFSYLLSSYEICLGLLIELHKHII